VGYPGTRLTSVQDRYRLEALQAIIGTTNGTEWFFGRLRGAGLVYSAWANNFAGVLDGYFVASAQCEADKAPQVLETMEELFGRAAAGGFTEEDLARAKSRLISAEALDRQTNADLAGQAALDELYGLGYDWHKGYAERITALTLEEVQEVAKRYFASPPTTTVITSQPEMLAENGAEN
jgi:zinc protease